MFFSMGHGRRVISAAGEVEPGKVQPQDAMGGGGRAPDQTFGYLFDGIADFPEIEGIDAKLTILAEAMQEQKPKSDALNGVLPPVMTYFGQFIDHDISVNTDSDNEASKIGTVPLQRQPRGVIEANVFNGRIGSLGLDSLYGDVPNPDAASEARQAAMRDGSFLREGMTTPIGNRPDLPRTGGDDLPRIGTLVDDGILDPNLLPDAVRPTSPTDPRNALAFIGDGRNDENLVVAQLHLAFLRFHNAVARKIRDDARGPISNDTVFNLARRAVTWTYQWIVINEYLPAICRRQDVDAVIEQGAPLWSSFFARLAQGNLADQLPLPFEFSAAAFRFGHTMVRDGYDFNRTFGRESLTQDRPERRASLTELFQFTGRAVDQPDAGPFGRAPDRVLPQNWIIEWDRFIESRPIFADRMARAIDTQLAPTLFNLLKEEDDANGIFKNLALRNLRRGYNMNLPSGQAVLAAMKDAGIALGPTMTKARLTSGVTGRALRTAGLENDAPLWFYVLKEAEEMEAGGRLGTVGSHLVADTIVGLILHDPNSYWHAAGSGPGGRWHPADGVMPLGRPVAGIADLLEAAGVLERAPQPATMAPLALFTSTAASAFRAPGLTAGMGAPLALVPDAKTPAGMQRNVTRAFVNAYEHLSLDFANKKPSDFFNARIEWLTNFRAKIERSLQEIYPDWLGFDDPTTEALFNEQFKVISIKVLAAIGDAYGIDPFEES